MLPPLIALITDFGLADPYVGIMKGVIKSLHPEIHLVDLTHDIPSGDIRRAAVVLWQSIQSFPAGTIFLGVIDPGVGTNRKGVLLESGGYFYVGPDNGLFTFCVVGGYSAVELTRQTFFRSPVSQTFHGRDVFAPVAAHVGSGVPMEAFGPGLDDIERLPEPSLTWNTSHQVTGEVLFADRFGNLITSIGSFSMKQTGLAFRSWLNPGEEMIFSGYEGFINIGERSELRLVNTFADLAPGEIGGVIGSSGLLEIVQNQQSADQALQTNSGDRVELILRPS